MCLHFYYINYEYVGFFIIEYVWIFMRKSSQLTTIKHSFRHGEVKHGYLITDYGLQPEENIFIGNVLVIVFVLVTCLFTKVVAVELIENNFIRFAVGC